MKKHDKMKFKCKIGIHNWSSDCQRCSDCGKTRMKQHNWKNDCSKCSRCQKSQNHQYYFAGNKLLCKNCKREFSEEIYFYYYLHNLPSDSDNYAEPEKSPNYNSIQTTLKKIKSDLWLKNLMKDAENEIVRKLTLCYWASLNIKENEEISCEFTENIQSQIRKGKISEKNLLKDLFLKFDDDESIRWDILEKLNHQDVIELYHKIDKKYSKEDVHKMFIESKYKLQLASVIFEEDILIKLIYEWNKHYLIQHRGIDVALRAIKNIKSQSILKGIVEDKRIPKEIKDHVYYRISDLEYLKNIWNQEDSAFKDNSLASVLGFDSLLLERALDGNRGALEYIKSEEDLAKIAIEGVGNGYCTTDSNVSYSADYDEFHGRWVESVREIAIKKINNPDLIQKVLDESSDSGIRKIAEELLKWRRKQ